MRAPWCAVATATGTVSFHPAYLAFCRDWDEQPRACAPYRARTKGKTEAGVKCVKRNTLADQAFASFGALEQHLAEGMTLADQRRHGTTREAPIARFERAERAMLQPLPNSGRTHTKERPVIALPAAALQAPPTGLERSLIRSAGIARPTITRPRCDTHYNDEQDRNEQGHPTNPTLRHEHVYRGVDQRERPEPPNEQRPGHRFSLAARSRNVMPFTGAAAAAARLSKRAAVC
jgi:hypothetical protein